MNWLQLAQAVFRETGLSSITGPTTYASATGDTLRIFEWVQQSAEAIYQARSDWRFRRKTATLASTTLSTLTDADFALTDFGQWKRPTQTYRPTCYRVAAGTGEETLLYPLVYDIFRARFLVGQQTAGIPQYFTISPAEEILLGPAPSEAVRLSFDYTAEYTPMTVETQTPALPANRHMAIVWRALMEYAGYDAASEAYQRAQANYTREWSALCREQLDAPAFRARALS